jgi:hypothetical protein
VLWSAALLNVVGSYLKLLKNKRDFTQPEVALSSSGSGDAVLVPEQEFASRGRKYTEDYLATS